VKRRWLLESTTKEYPAELIADDDGRGACRASKEHIGPIDPMPPL